MRSIAALALALFLALLAEAADADTFTYSAPDGDTLRLQEKDCKSEATLALIPPPLRGDFMAADSFVGGKRFSGCWRYVGSAAHIVWEDGDQGMVQIGQMQRRREL